MRLALPKITTAAPARKTRADGSITFDDWLGYHSFNFGGLEYPLLNTTLTASPQAEIQPNLMGLGEGAFKANGIVFACVTARMRLFSEAQVPVSAARVLRER